MLTPSKAFLTFLTLPGAFLGRPSSLAGWLSRPGCPLPGRMGLVLCHGSAHPAHRPLWVPSPLQALPPFGAVAQRLSGPERLFAPPLRRRRSLPSARPAPSSCRRLTEVGAESEGPFVAAPPPPSAAWLAAASCGRAGPGLLYLRRRARFSSAGGDAPVTET